MDYLELLLAERIREMAAKRVVLRTPEHLTPEEKDRFLVDEFPAEAREYLSELKNVVRIIKQPEASGSALDLSTLAQPPAAV